MSLDQPVFPSTKKIAQPNRSGKGSPVNSVEVIDLIASDEDESVVQGLVDAFAQRFTREQIQTLLLEANGNPDQVVSLQYSCIQNLCSR